MILTSQQLAFCKIDHGPLKERDIDVIARVESEIETLFQRREVILITLNAKKGEYEMSIV